MFLALIRLSIGVGLPLSVATEGGNSTRHITQKSTTKVLVVKISNPISLITFIKEVIIHKFNQNTNS